MAKLPSRHLVSLALLPYACAIAGPILAQTGLVPSRIAFNVFLVSALVGIVNALLGIFFVFRRKFLPSLIMGVGILPLILILAIGFRAGDAPLINDISTDLENPVSFVRAPELQENQGADFSYPDEFRATQKEGYPRLGPLLTPKQPDEILPTLEMIVGSMESTSIVAVDYENMTIEAHQTSGAFQFVDDFVIRIEPTESGSRIDMRSRSRVGKGDLGANARRIEYVWDKVRQALSTP